MRVGSSALSGLSRNQKMPVRKTDPGGFSAPSTYVSLCNRCKVFAIVFSFSNVFPTYFRFLLSFQKVLTFRQSYRIVYFSKRRGLQFQYWLMINSSFELVMMTPHRYLHRVVLKKSGVLKSFSTASLQNNNCFFEIFCFRTYRGGSQYRFKQAQQQNREQIVTKAIVACALLIDEPFSGHVRKKNITRKQPEMLLPGNRDHHA